MPSNQSYPTRNYALGEYLLTLRSRTKLTQAQLAAEIGIHRRSVQKWESGESYPTAENLRSLIEVLINLGVFLPGQERTEATELWHRIGQGSPQQFPHFDTAWLDQLLAGRHCAQPAVGAPTQIDDASARHSAPPVIEPPVIEPTSVRHVAKPAFNLPFQPTPLIGRSAELTEITRILADPACHLLTLIGPGGIGKTRLALEVAAQISVFRDGVAFVALTAVSAPHQIVSVIGEALNLSFAGQSDSTTHLLDYLHTRRMLLVLDDFEHLLEGADLVYAMLQAAPQLTILVTSRVRLNLQAEWLFAVEGLTYPPSDSYQWGAAQSGGALTDYSAVQLFVQRATQVQPGFVLSEAVLLAIVRICQYVAGMPLAIQLAATSVRLLPISEIERQIRSNLDLLATTLRDVPLRHRSLRAVFDQSWRQLSVVEQDLFCRLAVFRGGCTPIAAEQVAKATLPVLAALVDKSLVYQGNPELRAKSPHPIVSALQPRFGLLEPIREYALEKLTERDEVVALRRAHAHYYLALAEAAAAQDDSATVDAAFKQLNEEHNNLRAVLQWALEGGDGPSARSDQTMGLQLAGVLIKFWRRHGALSEGRNWLEALLALDDEPRDANTLRIRLRALQGAAWLASDQHDYARATELFEQSAALRRRVGEAADETNLLVNAALQARTVGQYPRATALLEVVVAQQRALDNRENFGSFGLGFSLFLLGMVQREQGDFARATALFEAGLQFHRKLGDREGVAVGLLGLSDSARDQGNVVQIHKYCTESLVSSRELGMQWAIGFALNNLALAAHLEGDWAHAVALASESVAIFRGLKAAGSLAEVLITLGQSLRGQRDVAAAHKALTEALQFAWTVGPQLFVASALEALASLVAPPGVDRQGAALTARCLAAASTLRLQLGTPVRPADQPIVERTLMTARSALGVDTLSIGALDPALASVVAAVRDLPLEQLLSALPKATSFAANAVSVVVQPAVASRHRWPRVDWGLAQDVPTLYGRIDELTTLTQWAMAEQCRVVTLVGLGGIGKTSLAVTFARQVAYHFTAVVFRSLGEAPPFAELLDQLIQSIAAQHADADLLAEMHSAIVAPVHLVDKLALFIDLLRQTRCLLILDNLETILQGGTAEAHYLAGYETYETLFKTVGETAHQSCLILTSRERLHELAPLEGPRTPVRSLRLVGLSETACRALLADQELAGTVDDAAVLAQQYAGNPLALKLVADPIRALFSGDIAAFLREGNLFFNGVGQLLAQQISRAAPLEQALLTWLAIGREPVALDQLMNDLMGGAPQAPSRTLVLAALHALWRRNLIERGPVNLTFTLQRVVLEYLTEQLVERGADELLRGEFDGVRRYALIQATAKAYVRQSQERLIAAPLLAQLTGAYGHADTLDRRLQTLLAEQRNQPLAAQGYGSGNLINLLRLHRGNLRGLDLTHLALRQVYLQRVELQDASLAGSLIQETIFTETFDAMTAVTISRTGAYWAAVSRRGRVRVWAAGAGPLGASAPGRLHLLWRAHAALVWTLAFSPDGSTLASGSWDGTIKLWDVATGALRWVGKHTSQLNRVAFDPDGRTLASAGSDATVRLWDVRSGAEVQTLPHPGPVAVVAWHPQGGLLVSGDLTGALRLWDVARADQPATCVQMLTEHTTWVDGLAFAPDGRTLASASYDGTVKLWNMAPALTLRATLTTPLAAAHRVVWSPDGRVLASCSFDRTIWLWDVEQHNYRAPLQGHTAVVYDLAFTPDSSRLLSASEDGTLRIWEVTNGQCAHVMAGYTGALYDVDWRPDGAALVSVGTDALVTIYSLTGEKEVPAAPRTLHGHLNSVFGVGWSPHGRWLASSELDNAIRLWETTSGVAFQVIHHPADPANLFYGLAWSPDGQRLASGTAKRGVLVWNVPANQPVWAGQPFLTQIRHVAWRPDGAQVAGGGDDGIVYVWDAFDGTMRQQLTGHQGMITRVAWSLDGTRLAASGSGREDGELLVWAVQTGERVDAFAGHPGVVYAVAWGASKDVVVSGGGDGMLRWWDVQQGVCMQARAAHQGAVQSLRRSPDGTQLASCGDDGVILLWDLHSGDYLQTLRRDRPYERLNITGIQGLTEAQKMGLRALGAVEF